MNIEDMILEKAVYLSADGDVRYTEETTTAGVSKTWEAKTTKTGYDSYIYRTHGWSRPDRRRRNVYDMWVKHRDGGPAYILEKPDGTVIEKYYFNGNLHREDGPASFDKKGKAMFRLNGKPVTAYEVLGDCPEAMFYALQEENAPKKKR